MSWKIPLAKKVAGYTTAGAGAFGLFGSISFDYVAGGIGLIGLAMGTLIYRLTPALEEMFKRLGPEIIKFRAAWKKEAFEIKASVSTNSDDIQSLRDQMEMIKHKDSEKDHVIGLQADNLARMNRQFAAISLAYASKLGLITPVNELAFDDDPRDKATDAVRAVLIVEDDPFTYKAYRSLLYHRGIKTFLVSTAADAITRLSDCPSCIILDLMLPGGGGEVVLREIRQRNLPVRVVVTTGISDPERFKGVMALGPDVMLTKPIDVETLLGAIQGDRPSSPRTSTPVIQERVP